MGSRIYLGGSTNPVGYCKYHRLTLSKKQLKSKDCLHKHCRWLIKYKDNPYWQTREKYETEKKLNRQKKKENERKEKKEMTKQELIKAIKYCKQAPENKIQQLEYCSNCKYSNKGCMGKIIDLIYDYLTTYEKETVEQWLTK